MFSLIIVFQILFRNGCTDWLLHCWESWMFCIFCPPVLLTVLDVWPIVALIFIFWWLMKLNIFSCYCPLVILFHWMPFQVFCPFLTFIFLFDLWEFLIHYEYVLYQMCITNTLTHSMGCPFTDWYTLMNRLSNAKVVQFTFFSSFFRTSILV